MDQILGSAPAPHEYSVRVELATFRMFYICRVTRRLEAVGPVTNRNISSLIKTA